MKTLAVHSGRFHADDVIAAATLSLFEKGELTIVRSRDLSVLAQADYVADVGSIYDPAHNHFDHHQTGGAGTRENGIPYAACGLVWKKFGTDVSGSIAVAKMIDERIIQPIDAADNGVATFTLLPPNVFPYLFQQVVSSYMPTWKEKDVSIDQKFLEVVELAKKLLLREIQVAKDILEGEEVVREAYKNAPDKKIIVLPEHFDYQDILRGFPEPIYAVYPADDGLTWRVHAIQEDPVKFTNRKDFPLSWAGKRDSELQQITGVADAVFSHGKRFLTVAKSQEGAIKLAQIALNA